MLRRTGAWRVSKVSPSRGNLPRGTRLRRMGCITILCQSSAVGESKGAIPGISGERLVFTTFFPRPQFNDGFPPNLLEPMACRYKERRIPSKGHVIARPSWREAEVSTEILSRMNHGDGGVSSGKVVSVQIYLILIFYFAYSFAHLLPSVSVCDGSEACSHSVCITHLMD